MIYTALVESPLGLIALTGDGHSLTSLAITGERPPDPKPGEIAPAKPELPLFDAVRRHLDDYFAGRRPDPRKLPLAPAGSLFARTVWDILLEIPYGCTMTYGEVAAVAARKLGKTRMAAQAVGGAVGANPIAIIIPCHRVMGARGNLTGYGGGLALKMKLLELENVDTTKFFAPQHGVSPRTRRQ